MICLGTGDLELYFLLSVSWIVIPVAALLALVPYFIVRARGWRAVPGNSIGLLLLNWWSWVVVACAIPGKLTGGGLPSVLELLVSESMSRAWNDRILAAALIVGCASWVALLLTTVAAGRVRAPSRRQMGAGLAVAIGAPCVAFVAAMLGGVFENAREDAAGERPELASERAIDEQLELLAEREERTQASLSEVRRMIASDGWAEAYPWMFRSCEREANPCYDIYTSAEVTRTHIDARDRARLDDELHNAGWRSSSRPQYCHGSDIESYRNEEGQRLCVEYGDETVAVALISPPYWGDLFELRGAAGPDALIFNPDMRNRTAAFRWDEWQTSDLAPR